MPERIASNLSSIAKWKDEIELAVVFWIIGVTGWRGDGRNINFLGEIAH